MSGMDKAKETAQQVGHRVEEAVQQATHRVEEAVTSAKNNVAHSGTKASEGGHDAQQHSAAAETGTSTSHTVGETGQQPGQKESLLQKVKHAVGLGKREAA